jgi:hypothetical protein
MAYNTRFKARFTDFFGIDYLVEIKEDNYSGLVRELNPGRTGFRMSYSGSNKTIQNYILGSKVEVDLFITTDTEKEFIKDLALNDDQHFLMSITRDKGTGFQSFWVGYVLADLVSFNDEAYPFIFKVVATDCFSALRNIDYTNSVWDSAGVPSSVEMDINELIHETIGLSGLTDHFDGNRWLAYTNDLPFLPTGYNSSLSNKLRAIGLDTNVFAQYDTSVDGVGYKYTNCYDVLEQVCKIFNARMFQWEGYIWFVPYYIYESNQLSCDFKVSDSSGTGDLDYGTIDLYADESDFNRFVGGVFDFTPAVKEVCVEHKYYYDPLLDMGEIETACGVTNAEINYKLFEGITFPGYNDYNGDSTLNVYIPEYRYKTLWGSQSTPVPTTSNSVLKLEVTSGDYVLTNTIASHNPMTFSGSVWKRNYEYSFGDFTNGQTIVDISDMDCFGLPASQDYIVALLNGVEIVDADFTYSQASKNITLVNSLDDSDVITIIIDNINHGRFYQLGTLTMNTQVLTSSSTEIAITIPPAPSDSGSDYFLKGSFEFYEDSGQFIPLGYTTDFYTDNISSDANYSAQPVDSSDTTKTCVENSTNSTEKVRIQTLIGGNTEHPSDGHILFKKLGVSGWSVADEWSFNTTTNVTYTGELNECIAEMNARLMAQPKLRYQGDIQRATSETFHPVKGLKVQGFNPTPDGMFMGTATLNAYEAEWAVQLIQL